MTKTSSKILEEIREKNIKPQAKWTFLLKNDVFWFLFLLFLLIVAISFAVIIDFLIWYDWDIYVYLQKSFFSYFLFSLPYIWFLFLIIFIFVASFEFTFIKGWYRHRMHKIILFSIAVSFVFGGILFYFGFGRAVDKTLSKNFSYYNFLKINKKNIWCHPEKGLLFGRAIEIITPEDFIIADCFGKKWSIHSNFEFINVGDDVKIIGTKINDYFFIAKEIRNLDFNIPINRKNINNQKPLNDICNLEEKCSN